MKLKIILIALCTLLLGTNVFTGYEWFKEDKEKKEYMKVLVKQNEIIDSLVNSPRWSVVLDIDLAVTDKSKFDVNGKNNSGTIFIPQEKKYVLEVEYDSITKIISMPYEKN